ncbi:uncharacterized protein JN550_012598 [Neoarthrinium moseri]|uniref:uncharacterized protein n=1 Tax=Neoarthrinium moseri TaxID=1658444 RepID=UPI001FDD743B|nr:uncharacterized protein JN550_012598 [Neoarthrinium moseri]KAI1858465.1 hypothetical protein JN550_012598 [Neoarthrinium moseri]
MRYEDWDVLLFPRDSKVPMKEFKTQCHVVHDNEFSLSHGSYGLPTMTCFMPGLPTGTSFNISLHCWNIPEISQFTRNAFSQHHDLVKFEARVFIDSRMVASASFKRTGPWPQLLNHSFEFTKGGELQQLKFPSFRSELLRQSYWSPADELGRIKIVISEGFPRDSLTVPMERVKNVVAFSFQHAPLDILESSAIAWPNTAMWRRGPFNPTMPVPTEHPSDGADSHIHSPRRRSGPDSISSGYNTQGLTGANIIGAMPNTQAFLQQSTMTSTHAPSISSYMDPFNTSNSDATSQFDWASGFGAVGHVPTATLHASKASKGARGAGKRSNSNVDMLDLGQGFFQGSQAHEDRDLNSIAMQVPANTPTTLQGQDFVEQLLAESDDTAGFPADLATTLTNSLLNQPMPISAPTASIPLPSSAVKSRKENLFGDATSDNTPILGLDHLDMRRVSQSVLPLQPRSGEVSSTNSPPSSRTFSGVFSNGSGSAGGDFGVNLTNVNTVPSFTHHGTDADTPGATASSNDKSVKRSRNATPPSTRAIDEEDEPRRSTPRVRIGFGEGMAG